MTLSTTEETLAVAAVTRFSYQRYRLSLNSYATEPFYNQEATNRSNAMRI